MTDKEARMILKQNALREVRKCAKVIYLIGDYQQMTCYLQGVVEYGTLVSSVEAEEIAEEISEECGGLRWTDVEEFRTMAGKM